MIFLVACHNKITCPAYQSKFILDEDVFKEQFYADVKAYKTTSKKNYDVRKKNKFYTKTAKKIFKQELAKRKKEI